MKKNSKKKLTDDDKKVWKHVTKTVTPFGEHDNTSRPAVINFNDALKYLLNIQQPIPKGPQAVLDLHGMTRNEAYKYLETQICICKTRKYKYIEVITGRGHGKGGDGLGILKRKVPLWLEGAKFKSLVKSWKQVPGNDGAIYVYLR